MRFEVRHCCCLPRLTVWLSVLNSRDSVADSPSTSLFLTSEDKADYRLAPEVSNSSNPEDTRLCLQLTFPPRTILVICRTRTELKDSLGLFAHNLKTSFFLCSWFENKFLEDFHGFVLECFKCGKCFCEV